jgi:hypothetical protein
MVQTLKGLPSGQVTPNLNVQIGTGDPVSGMFDAINKSGERFERRQRKAQRDDPWSGMR